MDARPWLYCAGKIAACDWRNEVFDTRNMDAWGAWDGPPHFRGPGDGGRHPDWRYAGPFFIGCDHSCGHGPSTHGCAASEPEDDALFFGGAGAAGGCIACGEGAPSREQVLEASLSCIRAADALFVWIDADFATAHGTVTEIGYAAALGKPIYSARSPAAAATNLVEVWFPLSLTRFFGTHERPEAPLRHALREYRVMRRWAA